jgi:hypothetical protein
VRMASSIDSGDPPESRTVLEIDMGAKVPRFGPGWVDLGSTAGEQNYAPKPEKHIEHMFDIVRMWILVTPSCIATPISLF